MFSKETYISRREKLKKQFQSGILLFLGNDECGINYEDNTYFYRQDSSFLYYFGISKPNLAAIIDIDADKEYIFGDEATIDLIVWTGSQPSIRELADRVGVKHTVGLSRLTEKLGKADKEKIHYLPPYRPEHILKLNHLLGYSKEEISARVSKKFIEAIATQRNMKSGEEIVEIEKAVTITSDMHKKAMNFALPGMTEAHVAAVVHETALAAGGNLSFPIIATINGQFLHNHYHGNTIKEGQLFLLDAGYETPLGFAGPKVKDGFWVLISIILALAVSLLMLKTGIPKLTFPFVLATWITLLLKNKLVPLLKRGKS